MGLKPINENKILKTYTQVMSIPNSYVPTSNNKKSPVVLFLVGQTYKTKEEKTEENHFPLFILIKELLAK